MVTVITGPINSGKTTKMEELFKKDFEGDGFISLKIMNKEIVEGFNIMKLSSHEIKPFIRRIGNVPQNWKENCRLGPYTVSEKALIWVTEDIKELIKKKEFPIYLDEIGMLEIKRSGFYLVLKELIEKKCETIISVRDENLDAVIDKFDIEDVKIIKTGERYA